MRLLSRGIYMFKFKYKEKFTHWIKTILEFCLNPRFLLCFGLAWFITNGWCYLMVGLGTALKVGWMIAVGGAYAAALWVPFTPEKIITVIIAIALLRLLFPNDQKTLKKLIDLKNSARAEWNEIKQKLKKRKQ